MGDARPRRGSRVLTRARPSPVVPATVLLLASGALGGWVVHRADGYALFPSEAAYRGLVHSRQLARELILGTGGWPELHPEVSPLALGLGTLLQLPVAAARPDPHVVELVASLATVVLLWPAWLLLRTLLGSPSDPGRGVAAALGMVIAGLCAAPLVPLGGLLPALVLLMGLQDGTRRRGVGLVAAGLAGLLGPVGVLVGGVLAVQRLGERRPVAALVTALVAGVPAALSAHWLLSAGWPTRAVLWSLPGPWMVLLVLVPALRRLPSWWSGSPVLLLGALALPGLAVQAWVLDSGPVWQSTGQVARFVAEWPLSGETAARPGAMVAWRADRPVVDLGCLGSPSLAALCDGEGTGLLRGVDAPGVRQALVARSAQEPPSGDLLGHSGTTVRRWRAEDPRAGVVDLVALDRGAVDELARKADRFAQRLPRGMSSETPTVDRRAWVPEPTDACGSGEAPVVLDLTGVDLVDGQGLMNGGRLYAGDSEVVLPGPWQAGRYALELAVEISAFDGEGARLELERDGVVEASWTLSEGAGRLERQPFELDLPWDGPLALRYVNDASDETRDRNVQLGRVRVERTGAFAPETRAHWLRKEVAGANLVLVSIDTLRADHLGAYGYSRPTSPVIDRLADRGTRFATAIAASHWTAPSHASLLTGLHPAQHGVRDFPAPGRMGSEITTLAEHLEAEGYATAAYAAGLYVGEGIGLAQGFDTWEEEVVLAETRFGQGADWVRAHAEEAGEDEPFFLFLHTYQVHDPYSPPEPYDRWFQQDPDRWPDRKLVAPLSETALQGWVPTAEELRGLVALYDGEIRYTDTSLGLLLDTLEELELTEDTLVVITSDHGEEFYEHGWVGHGRLYGELLRVPLVMAHPALPGVAARVVEQPTGHVDVVPTLLDLLGAPVPTDLPGRSAVPAMAGDCDPDARAWSSSAMNRERAVSLVDREVHYIDDDGRKHLFDLSLDRAEAVDLAGERPEETQARALEAEAWWGGLDLLVETEEVERSEAEIEQLRVLGYVD